jgi:hypothetical protein
MSQRRTHVLIWIVAALAGAVPLAACGKPAAVGGFSAASPTHPATAASNAPAEAAADAARAYLVSRDLAAVAGARQGRLMERLWPGSPAAAVEPLVATGRALVAARRGMLCVGAKTHVSLGPVAFFQGAEPVTASQVSTAGDAVTRAEVVCRASSTLTTSDGAQHTAVVDHVLMLLAAGPGTWLVYEDDYADPQQAEALAAAGAPSLQVWAAHQRVRDMARVRRASATAVGTVRAFVSLLNARRYLEAGFCLSPGFGGTARAMGATFRAIRVATAVPSGPSSSTRTVLRVTLRVQPRLALWNAGPNVRFITLERAGVGKPWRISAIDTGP